MGFLSSFDKGNLLLWGVMVFAGADGCGYGLSNCLEYLVVVPPAVATPKGLGATTEEVFQRASSRAKGEGRKSIFMPTVDLI